MVKLKELGNRIGKEEKDRIMEEFRGTLLDFCEAVVPNGSCRGNEWDCGDIFNAERAEGDRGSCSINLVSGVFYDQNPEANPQKGNAYDLFCAITGLKGAKAYRAIREWNEKRTLPDGTAGARSDRKVEVSEGSVIEATDEFEKERISWIGTLQDWKDDVLKHGSRYKPGSNYTNFNGSVLDGSPASEAVYIAEHLARYDSHIAWMVSDIFTRRWLQAVEFTQEPTIREKFAGELAEMRGLSKEVFFYLIDTGNIACVYERKPLKPKTVKSETTLWIEWIENDKKDPVEEGPPAPEEGYLNIAFPVCRDVTPDMEVPEWAGLRYFTPDTKIAFSKYPEEIGLPKPTVQFFGMHVPYKDKSNKSQWCYKPKGCPTQPWIIGDVSTADLVVLAESTWDAIAYIDLRKLWTWTKHTWAVIVTRGASNGQRIPADKIKAGAVVVRLLQNDAGNAKWVASLPAMPQAEHREIAPPDGIKDINDWI
jgi:hypothetical protein